MHFHQPWRKSENAKESCDRFVSQKNCSWVLTEFLLPFTKVLTQFVVFDWLQSCSSVGLHCASLLAHSLPQSEAVPSAFKSFSLCFTSSHVTSTATGWFLLSVYNHNMSITVKRYWRQHQKDIQIHRKILPNPKLHGIPLYGFLFLSVCLQTACIASEGADVFTQLCRDANTVTQLHKTPAYWLIIAQPWPAPDTTFPLNNWSQFAQGLLKTFLFSCAASAEPLGRCNSRSPAAAAAASQKRLSISPPTLSIHIRGK